MKQDSEFKLFCCCGVRKPDNFLKSAIIALLVLSVFFLLESIGIVIAFVVSSGDFSAVGAVYLFLVFDLTILIYASVCLCKLQNKKWKNFISFGTTVLVLSIVRLVLLGISFIFMLFWVWLLSGFIDTGNTDSGTIAAVVGLILTLFVISIILTCWSISVSLNIKKAAKLLHKDAKRNKNNQEYKRDQAFNSQNMTNSEHHNLNNQNNLRGPIPLDKNSMKKFAFMD